VLIKMCVELDSAEKEMYSIVTSTFADGSLKPLPSEIERLRSKIMLH